MDIPLESTSPSSRRNQSKLAEAIQSMKQLNNGMDALDLPVDPDAQATVTDFLDFTEYLPSDMIRSLTLIGNLDGKYGTASGNVHDLTKEYGALPSLPIDQRADPVVLRKQISENLGDAVSARTSAHAEALRMAENVDRHYNRAKNILAKLQDMLEKYPSSRDVSPVMQKKSPLATRTPKITLRLGNENKIRKHRAPRITVPGEVLAPYELDYESYGSSEDEEDEAITPRATPARSLTAGGTQKLKLKIVRGRKDKEKTPKPPKSAGQVGTNAHSAVAGISTSNALALLDAPPDDAKIGSKYLPWLELTAYELATLRKKMKKNAIWCPSDTMILRELKSRGRGLEAYRNAKAAAENAGVEFDSEVPPQLKGETVHAEGAISVAALNLQDAKLSNRGMKLNEAKKAKRENDAKVAAQSAAADMQETLLKATRTALGLFNQPSAGPSSKKQTKTPIKPVTKPQALKRKREDSVEEIATPIEGEASRAIRPALKRTKTETPIPVPVPISRQISSKQLATLSTLSTATSVTSEPPVSSSVEPANSPIKKVQTPILPPGKQRKSIVPVPEPTPSSSRPQRSAAIKTATLVTEPSSATIGKRPTSSRGEATATLDRPRRTSTTRTTPLPAATPTQETRQLPKRSKRPTPGTAAPNAEGASNAVVSTQRKATTKKKMSKKEKREGSAIVYDEIDDQGNVIDPNEPRYCVCHRVSFGIMIGCENNDVSILFHSMLFLCKPKRVVANNFQFSVRRNGSILNVLVSNRFRRERPNGIVLSVGLRSASAKRVRLVLGERRSSQGDFT